MGGRDGGGSGTIRRRPVIIEPWARSRGLVVTGPLAARIMAPQQGVATNKINRVAVRGEVDPHALRAAVAETLPWLDGTAERPERTVLGNAVRLSLRVLAQVSPGHSVEVRVPPFAAVQCVPGPRHTRGTPPNVIETDPRTWLLLALGRLTWTEAMATGQVNASGSRADISALLPVVRL